jgi:hemerythrin
MSSFVWSEKYSVNIKEIDDQHKKLIGLVGTLDDAMLQGKGKQVLEKILGELIQYTKTHFATEERYMKTHGYPEYGEHKDKHDKMTQKVLEVQKEYQAGKITITHEVMKFLQDWVDKHILGTDKKYQPFLKSKGVQ